MKIILTLSHGQASVERGFSINKSLLVHNLTETSLISERIVLDHLRSKNVSSEIFEVCEKIRKTVRSVRGKYYFFGRSEKGKTEQREGFKTKVNSRRDRYGES